MYLFAHPTSSKPSLKVKVHLDYSSFSMEKEAETIDNQARKPPWECGNCKV